MRDVPSLFRCVDDLRRDFAAGDLSPVDVAEACLARIEERNEALQAFCLVDRESALFQARESEARWRADTPLSPLDGIPVGVKDLVLTKNWPTAKGSAALSLDGPWTEDAPAVARLREAGAVLLGKTTTCDHGWKAVTDNPATGLVARNPWDETKTPGGSSGGSAAALASGMCVLALGTDGGGSVRVPCAFTGLFGLKPTFGRVPAWPPSGFATLAHVGPMARTVRDAAHFLDVLARPDARDWYASGPPTTDYAECLNDGVKDLRIAYSPALRHAVVDGEVARLVDAAAHRFEDLGAHVEQIDPFEEDPRKIFRMHWWAGAAATLDGLPDEAMARLDPALSEIVEEGRKIRLGDYQKAVKAREIFGTGLQKFLNEYDLLITPAVTVPAFEAGRNAPDGWSGYGELHHWLGWAAMSYPFNLSQQPAASVPCGFTDKGLPVGLQIVAAKFRDDLVLRAAAAYELAHPVFKRRPRAGAPQKEQERRI